MINSAEKNELRPVCPFCKTDIETVWFQEMSGILGRRYLYFCPHCRSVLGVSHRKGFWMG
jgi:hypothetical protein